MNFICKIIILKLILIFYKKLLQQIKTEFYISMSRGNVFKLSGNLALGNNNDTYSTSQLQSIKSSLRLLKAKQSQKKSQHNIDIGYNYGGSYSSNTAQRSDLKRNQINNDYNYYQNNAKNHMPSNNYANNRDSYDQPIKAASKNSMYQNERDFPIRNKNSNYSSLPKNDYNSYNNNAYNQGSLKQMSARNQIKNKTTNIKAYDQEQYQPQGYKNQEDSRPKAQTRPPLRKQQLNQQASDYDSYQKPKPKNIEQKSIKQANKNNKIQIVEYDPSSFVQCTAGCGRKFNPDSISKHEANCIKVFQKKRKQFNMQQQRIANNQYINNQQKRIVQNQAKKSSNNPPSKQSNKNNSKSDEKMSKWKAQSIAFRAMLKSDKKGEMTAEQKKQIEQVQNIGMIKCPHCGRTFNQNAGPKHITFCQTQSKKNKFKK